MPTRALIVDDEPDLELLICQKFRKKIRSGEYQFVFARNGLEALAKLEEDPTLDIVLSDINMPGMDGLTFLSRLSDLNRYIKAVMVSAYGDMHNIRTAMNRGAYDFLTKPIDFQDFEVTLNKTIQEHQTIKEGLQAREQVIVMKAQAEAKSTFLATISHEIRTPLNAIIGMADVLSGEPLAPEQRRCVEVLQRNGVGLLTLIDDILDLAKVETGHVDLESIPFDLRNVIARAMEVVEGRASAKGLYLRTSIAPQVPYQLIGDPNRLRQILINLLGNALKFTERGGIEIRVDVDPEDAAPSRLRIGVVDTGIGIPADKVDRIFQSFAQVDSSTTRKYGGTGLGLTISKQLVELMQGRIWVESEPGAGSTFFFTAEFGVQENQSERGTEAMAQPAVQDLESLPAGLSILLVDDSDDNRFLILSYLRDTHSTIDIAEDGADAVKLFDRGRYDVVLMDIEMPAMDGYAATREIRRMEDAKRSTPTPILALTAHAFAGMAEKALAAGFTDLLTKPIRKNILVDALVRHAPAAQPPDSQPQDPRIRVRVDEELKDVVPGYLGKRRDEESAYRAALEAADFDSITKMAHKMKGTGAGYGFPQLTELGAALEQAALRADAAEIAAQLGALTRFLASIELE